MCGPEPVEADLVRTSGGRYGVASRYGLPDSQDLLVIGVASIDSAKIGAVVEDDPAGLPVAVSAAGQQICAAADGYRFTSTGGLAACDREGIGQIVAIGGDAVILDEGVVRRDRDGQKDGCHHHGDQQLDQGKPAFVYHGLMISVSEMEVCHSKPDI